MSQCQNLDEAVRRIQMSVLCVARDEWIEECIPEREKTGIFLRTVFFCSVSWGQSLMFIYRWGAVKGNLRTLKDLPVWQIQSELPFNLVIICDITNNAYREEHLLLTDKTSLFMNHHKNVSRYWRGCDTSQYWQSVRPIFCATPSSWPAGYVDTLTFSATGLPHPLESLTQHRNYTESSRRLYTECLLCGATGCVASIQLSVLYRSCNGSFQWPWVVESVNYIQLVLLFYTVLFSEQIKHNFVWPPLWSSGQSS
jgi:hypothetical protein